MRIRITFIFEFSKMEKIVEKSGSEHFAAVPKKVERIVDLFKTRYLWVRLGRV
jgi:hypothetical protein